MTAPHESWQKGRIDSVEIVQPQYADRHFNIISGVNVIDIAGQRFRYSVYTID